jgi:hypothetical protein
MTADLHQSAEQWMRELEVSNRPPPSFMAKERVVTEKMRAILVEWLFCVHGEKHNYYTNEAQNLAQDREIIHACVNYLDRFLGAQRGGPMMVAITTKNLQQLGLTCFWIALKIHMNIAQERWDVPDLQYLCDGSFPGKRSWTTMEACVARTLDWRFTVATPDFFIKAWRTQDLGRPPLYWHSVALMVDLAMLDYEFCALAYVPSLVVACAMLLLCEDDYEVECVYRLSGYEAVSGGKVLQGAQALFAALKRVQEPHVPKNSILKAYAKTGTAPLATILAGVAWDFLDPDVAVVTAPILTDSVEAVKKKQWRRIAIAKNIMSVVMVIDDRTGVGDIVTDPIIIVD